jgi:hypothetical protein
MSGLLAGKVWQSALDPRLKPLAAALADIANDNGTSIFPSIAYIAWLLGDDIEPSDKPRMERTVQRGIKDLRELGILIHVGYRRYNRHTRTFEPTVAQGRSSTPEYTLVEAALPERRPWQEKGDNLSQPALERVTPVTGKGDKTTNERVTNGREKGDTSVTRSVLEPSIEPPVDPLAALRSISFQRSGARP